MTTVELTAYEARCAHIAASKMGYDRDVGAMEELYRAFEADQADDPGRSRPAPKQTMWFGANPIQLNRIALLVQQHGQARGERGHERSARKYRRIGRKIERQLILQGSGSI